MSSIAKNHDPHRSGLAGQAGSAADPHPDPWPVAADRFWLAPPTGLVARLQEAMAQARVHPAEVVVLLPYAHLMVTARRYWARACPDGFAPRFETTLNWARACGLPLPAGEDLTLDAAHDVLTARDLLERAGLREQARQLAPGLAESAGQLMRCVASQLPAERERWGAQAREALSLGLEAPVLAYEAACARIALEWALASTQGTDLLFGPALAGTRLLLVLDGFQADPLTDALVRHAQADPDRQVRRFDLPGPWLEMASTPSAQLHACRDGEDEAERAAAVVLQRVQAGQWPVALVSLDRAITRRISAMLAARRIPLRDESGWKLSTTRAAAQVMSLLRAAHWNPSTDEVLDWLKGAPRWRGACLDHCESRWRRLGLRDWRRALAAGVGSFAGDDAGGEAADWLGQVDALRTTLTAPRPLAAWLLSLREALRDSGQWDGLQDDPAGARLLSVLRLDEASQALWMQSLSDTPWASRRMDPGEFTAWVHQALEAASFMADELPVYVDAQVVVLPLSQLLARPWGAVVVPGCDEQRLPASPEPPGAWTSAQRQALGLPLRQDLQQAQAAAWRHALSQPRVDLLWRESDDGGEPLLPSALVQELQTRPGQGLAAQEPRVAHRLAATPVQRPLPVGRDLPLQRLSASAYEDLRRCPYRFFALRQLGLQTSDELDAEVDKRDFGLWLHEVLKRFHDALTQAPSAERAERRELLTQAAAEATRHQGLEAEEFLPFEAVWPQVREGYLDWLDEHERAEGGQALWGERWLERPHAGLQLVGQIDRLDQVRAQAPEQGGARLVIDYKTESLQRTRERLKAAGEDTQLAFYAALLQGDGAATGQDQTPADLPLRAAYVHVGEGGKTELLEQPEVETLRDALLAGIAHDLERLTHGAVLPALGDGAVCDFCAARGLCRKDFWSAAPAQETRLD